MSNEQHGHEDAFLQGHHQPLEFSGLAIDAGHALTLNSEWIAYLAEVELPSQVAGVDHSIHHAGPESEVGYA